MNIWFDITHLAQYNFYKNSILKLAYSHNVFITLIDRGKLPIIVSKEIGLTKNLTIYIVGKHRGNRLSAIIEGNLVRIIKLSFWAINKKIDISFSNGFASSFVGLFSHQKTYTFGDDPDTFDYNPKRFFSTVSHYCLYESPKNSKLADNIVILKTLKEWSYLSVDYFTPNPSVLVKYNLKQYEYFFVREVITGTNNYKEQSEGLLLDNVKWFPEKYPVLLSLEDKSKASMFPANWFVLEEPVEDIHSLIYYSRGLVSSGDSMAREAALLGVESYYLGVREMPANAIANRFGLLKGLNDAYIGDWIIDIVSRDTEKIKKNQLFIRDRINNNFIDIVKYINNFVK